jgi:hypothetical protein
MLLEIRTGWPKENETGVLRDPKPRFFEKQSEFDLQKEHGKGYQKINHLKT